ncbi:MAG TPA: hypothetical protein VF824_02590 [Thermoanaerobaculia bacterium]
MAEFIELARDVLDQQLVDRNGRNAGKVDGIAFEWTAGEPPRVVYLDAGTDILARRLSPRLERLLQRVRRLFRRDDPTPFQIEWSRVMHVGLAVEIDIDSATEAPEHVERWLAKHVIGRIPGAQRGTR